MLLHKIAFAFSPLSLRERIGVRATDNNVQKSSDERQLRRTIPSATIANNYR